MRSPTSRRRPAVTNTVLTAEELDALAKRHAHCPDPMCKVCRLIATVQAAQNDLKKALTVAMRLREQLD